MEVRFFVPGLPIAQGSKRHVGHGIMVEMSKKLPAWRNDVRLAGIEAMGQRPPLADAVFLHLTFVFPRPKAHFGTGRNAGQLKPTAPVHVTKAPDLDKLVRAVGDALTGIVWRDDAQVAVLEAHKVFGIHPQVQLVARPIPV